MNHLLSKRQEKLAFYSEQASGTSQRMNLVSVIFLKLAGYPYKLIKDKKGSVSPETI